MIRVILAALLLMGFTEGSKVTLDEIGVVRLDYVRSDHWAMRNGETAKAVRTEDGQKWILINLDADQTDFDQWFLHEMAHHAAWQKHGEDIQTHGPEFRRICRQLVTRRVNYFCNGS